MVTQVKKGHGDGWRNGMTICANWWQSERAQPSKHSTPDNYLSNGEKFVEEELAK